MPSGHFSNISGDSGFISAAAGAKVGVISKWNIMPVRQKSDGTTELRFKAQFSWRSNTLMNMIGRGALKARATVQLRNIHNKIEDIDILAWQEWRFEGNILTLEDVTYFENRKLTPHVVAR